MKRTMDLGRGCRGAKRSDTNGYHDPLQRSDRLEGAFSCFDACVSLHKGEGGTYRLKCRPNEKLVSHANIGLLHDAPVLFDLCCLKA